MILSAVKPSLRIAFLAAAVRRAVLDTSSPRMLPDSLSLQHGSAKLP